MLALQTHENRLCPICGLPTRICHDQDETEALYRGASVEICNVAYMRNQALRAYRDSGAPDPNAEGAITTKLNPRITVNQ